MLHFRKPKLLLWSDISLSQIDSFNNSSDNDIIRNNLLKIFDLCSYDSEIKQEIMQDLYFYSYKFCKENNFSEEQISVFLSLIHNIHKLNSETSFDNSEAVFRFFNECLLLHSVHRPPFSLQIFNTDQYKLVSDYVIDTYFRHFKMYKYTFTPEVTLDLNIDYPNIPKQEKEIETNQPEISACSEENIDQQDSSADQNISSTVIDDEPDSIQTLRKFIRTFLNEEVKKVKGDIDDRFKVVRETINSKLSTIENESATKGKKSAKESGNKAKKK